MMMKFVLLLAVVPSGCAFVSQAPKTASTTELGMAWHDYVRTDPYNKNRNGEISVLRNDLYRQRERLGNVQQPYSQNDRLSWSDSRYNGYRNSGSYHGPFANNDASRRYGYGNGNYAYGYNSMRDGYSTRLNNGRFPPEDDYSRKSLSGYDNNNYSSHQSRYGYNNNGYGSNNGYSNQGRYGYSNNNVGYSNNYNNNGYGGNYNSRNSYGGPFLNSGRFPDENGSISRYGYNEQDYQQRGYGNRNSYGSGGNGYYNDYSRNSNGYNSNSRYGQDSSYNYGGYGGRSGYGRSW